MRPIVTYVLWSVGHNHVWTHRDVDAFGPKEPCIKWGPGSHTRGRGSFRGNLLRCRLSTEFFGHLFVVAILTNRLVQLMKIYKLCVRLGPYGDELSKWLKIYLIVYLIYKSKSPYVPVLYSLHSFSRPGPNFACGILPSLNVQDRAFSEGLCAMPPTTVASRYKLQVYYT